MMKLKSAVSKLVGLFAICLALFVVACQNPIRPSGGASDAATGPGTISLRIAHGETAARTITPTVTLAPTTVFRLVFTPQSGDPEVFLRSNDNSDTDYVRNDITLEAGTYLLVITAYNSPENRAAERPMARGEQPVTITAGSNIAPTITLTPYDVGQGETGTFSWNITLPNDVSEARMYVESITGFTGTTPSQSPWNLLSAGNGTGNVDLAAGFYSVTVMLDNPLNAWPVFWSEVLHIHGGMTSSFSKDFTAGEYFRVRAFPVTFNYNHGSRPTETFSFFFDQFNPDPPSGLNVRGAQFTFRGWYTEQCCADFRGATPNPCDVCGGNSAWTPGTHLTGPITLYAGWRVAGAWNVGDEDGFTTADLVQPVGDELEFGWWVRAAVLGTWRSGRVQPLGDDGGTLPMPPLALGFNFQGTTTNNPPIDEDGVTIPVISVGTAAFTSAWQRLPVELGGAPVGTAQTDGAEWRIRRTGNVPGGNRNFAPAIDGVNRMFPHVGDTVSRAAVVQNAVRTLISDTIQFRIDSEGEDETRVEFVVIEAGFDFDDLRDIPHILPHAAGEISALDDILAGRLTTELARLRALTPAPTDEQINSALELYITNFIYHPVEGQPGVRVRATQVERVWWNAPDTNFNAVFRDPWVDHYNFTLGTGPGNGPEMFVGFRNIPAAIEINRWRASVEWYVHADNAAAPGQNTNRVMAFNHRVPIMVEYIFAGTNFRAPTQTDTTQGWSDMALASTTTDQIIETPAIRVSQSTNALGGTAATGNTAAPLRRVRLEVDVPITHVVVPGTTTPAFDPVLFEAVGGGIYWRAPVTALPRTTLEHTITGFRGFSAGANNVAGEIQYSTVARGHQDYLDIPGERPPLHTWVVSTCAEGDCDCPHIMGGFEEFNILPSITGVLESAGERIGAYTISIPAGYVVITDRRFSQVNSRIDFTLDADIHQLVTNANMTVNGQPVQGSGRNRYFVFESPIIRHHNLDIRLTF